MSVKDIPIAIEIKIEDAPYNDTVSKLNEISRLLDGISSKAANSVQKGFGAAADAMKDTGKEAEELRKKMKGGLNMEDLAKALSPDVKKAMKDQTKEELSEIKERQRVYAQYMKERENEENLEIKSRNEIYETAYAQQTMRKEMGNTKASYISTEDSLISMGKAYRDLNSVSKETSDKFDTFIGSVKTLKENNVSSSASLNALTTDFGKLSPVQKNLLLNYENLQDVATKSGVTFDNLAKTMLVNEDSNMRLNALNQVLGRSWGQMTPIMKDIVMRFDEYDQAAKRAGVSTEEWVRGFISSEAAVAKNVSRIKEMNEVLAQAAIYSQLDNDAKMVVEKTLGMDADAAAAYEQKVRSQAEAQKYATEQAREMNIQFQMSQASMGNLGRAINSIGKSLLWVGLGTMFATMSFGRASKASYTLESAQYSLKKSYMSLIESQNAYNTAVNDYGRNSEEAIKANLALEDSQMAVKMQENSLRSAIEQQNFAWVQYYAGLIPSIISSSTMLSSALWQTFAAQKMKNTEDINGVTTSLASTGANQVQAASVRVLGMAYWQLAIAVGAATFGLNIIIAAVGSWVAENQAAEQMKKIRLEAEALEDELTGHTLVDSIAITSAETTKFSKTLKDATTDMHSLTKATSKDLTLETSIVNSAVGFTGTGSNRILTAIPVKDVGSNSKALVNGIDKVSSNLENMTPSITINMNGEYNIRSDDDISNLADEIESRLMKKYYNVRGRY